MAIVSGSLKLRSVYEASARRRGRFFAASSSGWFGREGRGGQSQGADRRQCRHCGHRLQELSS